MGKHVFSLSEWCHHLHCLQTRPAHCHGYPFLPTRRPLSGPSVLPPLPRLASVTFLHLSPGPFRAPAQLPHPRHPRPAGSPSPTLPGTALLDIKRSCCFLMCSMLPAGGGKVFKAPRGLAQVLPNHPGSYSSSGNSDQPYPFSSLPWHILT